MSLLDRAIVKAYREAHLNQVQRQAPAHPPIQQPHTIQQPVSIPLSPAPQRAPVESRENTVLRGWNWPRITQQLLNQSEAGFQHLARQLLASAANRNEKVVAFFGTARGEGCSSVLLTLAHVLARQKEPRILLVDADDAQTSLGSLLYPANAAPQNLNTTGNAPLKLSGSNISLLAPAKTGTEKTSTATLESWLGNSRDQYDLVLVDAGVIPSDQPLQHAGMTGTLDAAIAVVSSKQRLANSPASEEERRWTDAGIAWLGMIETFA